MYPNNRALFPLFCVIVIDMVGIGLIFPVLGPLFMHPTEGILSADTSLFTREMWYSLMVGTFSFFMFFGAPFLGDLSDQIGRKRVLLICLLGTALGFFLCALGIFYKSLALLLFGRAITGFAAGSQPLAQAAIVDISVQDNKARNLSMIVMVQAFGFVVGPMIGGYFSGSSLSTPFLLAGILAALNCVYLIMGFTETFVVTEKKKLDLMKGLKIFKAAFEDVHIRQLSLIFLWIQLAWSLYLQFVALFLTQAHQFDAERIGYFYAFIAFIFGLTMLGIMRICLRYMTVEVIARWSTIIMAIGFFMAAMSTQEWAHWVSLVPITIGIALSIVSLLTMFSNAVGPEAQGWVMGVSSAVMAMAWLLTGFASGILTYLSLVFPFILCGILACVSFWSMRRMKTYGH